MRSNLFGMIVILLMAFGSFLIAPLIKLFSIPASLSIVLNEIIFLFIPVVVYIAVTKQSAKNTLRLNRLSFPALMLSIFIGMLVFPMAIFIGNLSQLVFHNYLQDAFTAMQSMSFIGFIGAIALTPAIFEELTMRGIVFSGYKRIDIKKAALMNGLFFGLMHLNPQQFLYAFIIGIIFAYMVFYTDSILSSMVCHFTCDGISAVINFFTMKVLLNQTSKIPDINSLPVNTRIISLLVQFIVFVVCLALIILLVKALASLSQNRVAERSASYSSGLSTGDTEVIFVDNSERAFNWPVYVTIVIFLVFSTAIEIASRVIK
jgi:membrane protease YdiL (CAAX protease family)